MLAAVKRGPAVDVDRHNACAFKQHIGWCVEVELIEIAMLLDGFEFAAGFCWPCGATLVRTTPASVLTWVTTVRRERANASHIASSELSRSRPMTGMQVIVTSLCAMRGVRRKRLRISCMGSKQAQRPDLRHSSRGVKMQLDEAQSAPLEEYAGRTLLQPDRAAVS